MTSLFVLGDPRADGQDLKMTFEAEIVARRKHLMGLVKARRYREALRAGRAMCEFADKAGAREEHARALLLVARLALDAGLLEVAGRCYHAAAELPEFRAPSLEGKGLVLHRMGHHQGALQALQAALELAPAKSPILQKLAHVYRDMDEPTQARLRLIEALQINPEDVSCLLQLAAVCKHLRLYGEALTLTRRAYDLDPRQGHLRRDILRLHQILGHRDEARQVLESELRQLDPAEPAYLDGLKLRETLTHAEGAASLLETARTRLRDGHTAEALETLTEVRSLAGCYHLPEAMELWETAARVCRRGALEGGWPVREIQAHAGAINALVLRPDRKSGVTAGKDGQIALWDLDQGAALRVLVPNKKTAVTSLALSRHGVLAASADGTVKRWELGTGRCLGTYQARSAVLGLQLTADEHWAYLSGGEGIQLLDLEAGKLVRTMEGNDFTANCLSSDESLLLSGRMSGLWEMWDTASGKLLDRIIVVDPTRKARQSTATGSQPRRTALRSMTMTRDKTLALTLSQDGTLCRWNLRDGSVDFFEGRQGAGGSLCLSQDEETLFVGGRDRSLTAWNVSTGGLLKEWQGAGGRITGLDANGTRLVSGGLDGKIRVWGLEWALEAASGDWDEKADAFLTNFLAQQTPRLVVMGEAQGLPARRGRPFWEDKDVAELRRNLAAAGLGWLAMAEIQKRLRLGV